MTGNTPGELHDIRAALDDLRTSSRRGFASLAVFGAAILITGVISLFVSARMASLVMMILGCLAVPATFAFERILGYRRIAQDNPLRPLIAQLAVGKLVAFFAAIVAYLLNPTATSAVFAAIVGGYYLPFAWLYGTRIYAVLGVIIGSVPWVVMVMVGTKTYPYVLIAWGAVDWIAALMIHQQFRRRDMPAQVT